MNLAEMGREELLRRRKRSDDRVTSLFRRWPALNDVELKELRYEYAERQRLARNLGRLRRLRRRRAP